MPACFLKLQGPRFPATVCIVQTTGSRLQPPGFSLQVPSCPFMPIARPSRPQCSLTVVAHGTRLEWFSMSFVAALATLASLLRRANSLNQHFGVRDVALHVAGMSWTAYFGVACWHHILAPGTFWRRDLSSAFGVVYFWRRNFAVGF